MKVILNGSAFETMATYVTYETICFSCGYSPDHNPSVVFSRGRNLEQGCLFKGMIIELSEGISIECMITGNA